MSIESSCDERLWASVRKSYEERNYSATILNGIQFLGDFIRDKTGLTSDGMTLIGEAFGSNKPKLKVNRFETETDKSIQSGIEHLVRGIYRAFRNPRSHETIADSSNDADTVLMLVSYLLKVIGQAKAQFEKSSFIQRVFDPEFVETDHYATLLIAEVPAKYRFDLMVDIYRDRLTGSARKLRYTVCALWKVLSDEAKDEFAAVVSYDLNRIDKTELALLIALLPKALWPHCSDVSRMRTETLLINAIKVGAYDIRKQECTAGHLGSWSSYLIPSALLSNEFQTAIAGRLNSEQDGAIEFVFKYLLSHVYASTDKPSFRLSIALREGLNRGDIRFKEALAFINATKFDVETFDYSDDLEYPNWNTALKEDFGNFVEKELDQGDDIPF